MKTYYCPKGCNVLDTYDTAPECGACGSRMTEDVEAFEDAHERRELEGIAAHERAMEQEEPIDSAEANKTVVFEALSKAGITHVSVDFDGEGDQGQVDKPSAYTAGECIEFPQLKVKLRLAEYGVPELIACEMNLLGAVERLCYDYLEQEHGGWETDAGSSGEFVFDVVARTITLDFYGRIVDAAHSVHTF